MPGTSCNNCVFATVDGQTQTGCFLDRTEKFTSVDIFHDFYTGTFKVLPNDVCAAKRHKAWLANVKGNSLEAVMNELKPKVQLILLIEDVTDEWVKFLREADLSQYSAIDVIVQQKEKDVFAMLGFLVWQKNFFLHATIDDKFNSVNRFVRSDCQFYVLISDCENNSALLWPARLHSYMNEQCKGVMMCQEEDSSNDLVIFTQLHLYLGGWGTQTLPEKIRIHCENHDCSSLVVDWSQNGTT